MGGNTSGLHHHLVSWGVPGGSFAGSTWKLYTDTVAGYTKRQLTFAADRLPAIPGTNSAIFSGSGQVKEPLMATGNVRL